MRQDGALFCRGDIPDPGVGRRRYNLCSITIEGGTYDSVGVSEHCDLLAGGEVPDPRGIVGRTGDELHPARTKGCGGHAVVVTAEDRDFMASGGIPDSHRV